MQAEGGEQVKNKQIEIKDLLVASLDEKKTLDSINRQLVYIKEKIEPIKISVAVDGGTIDLGQVHIAFQNITEIARNTSNEIISLIENAVQQMGVLQTQMANLHQMQGKQGESFSINEYSSIIDIMVNLGSVILSVIKNWKALKNIVTIVRNGLSALTGPVGLVSSLLGTFAIKGISEFIERRQQQQEMEQENDRIVESYAKHAQAIDELVGAYERLNKLGNGRSTEQEREYIDIQNQLHQMMPQMTASIDEQGNARLRSVEAVKQEYEYAKKLKEIDDQRATQDFFEKFDSNFKNNFNDLKDVQKKLRPFNSPDYSPDYGYSTAGGYKIKYPKSEHQQLKEKEEKLFLDRQQNAVYQENAALLKAQLEVQSKLSAVGKNLNQQQRDYINSLIDQNAKMLTSEKEFKAFAGEMEFLSETMGTMYSLMGDGFNVETFDQITKNKNTFNEFLATVERFKDGRMTLDAFSNQLSKFGFFVEDVEKASTFLHNSGVLDMITGALNKQRYETFLTSDAFKEYANTQEQAAVVIDDISQRFDNASTNISNLTSILRDLNDHQGLSTNSMAMILSKYPEYISSINDEITLKKKLEEGIEKEKRLAQELLTEKLYTNEQFYENTIKNNQELSDWLRSNGYEIDLNNYKTLMELKHKVENAYISDSMKKWSKYYDIITPGLSPQERLTQDGFYAIYEPYENTMFALNHPDAIKKTSLSEKEKIEFQQVYKEQELAHAQNEAKMAEFQKWLDGIKLPEISFGGKPNGGTGDGDPGPIALYKSDKYSIEMADYDQSLKESETNMRSYVATSQEYRDELENQIEILDKKLTRTGTEVGEIDGQLTELEKERLAAQENTEEMNKILREIDELTRKRQSLISSKWDFKLAYDEKSHELQMISFEKLNSDLEEYDYQLSIVQARKQQYEEGSTEFNQALLEENKIYADKRQSLSNQINALEAHLKTLTQGTTQYQEVIKTIRSLKLEYEQVESSIKSTNETIAKSTEALREKIKDGIDLLFNDEIERIERQKEEIKKFYQTKIDAIQEEIDRLEERNDALAEEEERQKRLSDIAEQRRKLNNILKERNTKILNADGSFSWAANPNTVEEETKKLKELETDYYKWEEDLKRKREIDDLRNQIISLQEKLKKEEDAYDQQIKNLRDFIEESKKEQSIFTEDQIAMVDTLIAQIKTLEDGSYENRLISLQGFVEQYNKLVDSMKAPISHGYSSDDDSSWGNFGVIAGDKISSGKDGKINVETEGGGKGSYDPGTGNFEWDFRDSKFHEGGIVGNNNKNNRITHLLNKAFNVKPDEQIIKALKGELYIPPKNIGNIMDTMSKLVNFSPAAILTTDSAADSIIIQNVHLPNVKDGDSFVKELSNFKLKALQKPKR